MSDDKRDFDAGAASWDEEPRRVKLANDVADAISAEIALGPSMDVLDFGCGTGLVAVQLSPLVRSVTGVDTSRGMLDIFKTKVEQQHLTNVSTRFLDLDRGDVLQGSYHLIVSTMTLHHVKDIGPLLEQFHEIMVPGGYLCIVDLDLEDGQFHSDNEGVFHHGFDRAELRMDFINAGFEDVRDTTAATMTKPIASGEERRFTVFLMSARKK
ncbi:MAG: methyltransferase domain-containing protein [Desulfomonile tiedjei]|nr:methyltransferase domain-containing protein [Desulfomonile tiedjei]